LPQIPAHQRLCFLSRCSRSNGVSKCQRHASHPQPGDGRWSNSFDLLFRGLELVTGGQRLHRHSDYLAAIHARGEDPAAYSDYLEAFAHGMPPHGGFAIGLERWTAA
jgi:nondiscriminating aspartyl-tRNA synthetase